jgi:trehalose-phosphatase
MKHIFEEKQQILECITRTRTIIILDYDGTLTPIVDSPGEAALSQSTKRLLESLAKRKNTFVSIVSGRSLADIKHHVDVPNIVYAGVHGYESDIQKEAYAIPHQSKHALQSIKQCLSQKQTSYPGVLLEDKTLSLAIHYRLLAPEKTAEFLHVVRTITAPYIQDHSVTIKEGKKVFELVIDDSWNKGTFVGMYLQSLNATPHRDTIIYIGDDTTDEDVFVQFPEAITINVGGIRSKARYWVKNTQETTDVLQWIASSAY